MEKDGLDSDSVFVEYFGSSPYIKVLDFLLTGLIFDYNMTEVARGAGVGWSAFTKIWEHMLAKKIIVPTRTIGNAKLFRLNNENLIVQKLVKIDSEITKIATDEMLKEQEVTV